MYLKIASYQLTMVYHQPIMTKPSTHNDYITNSQWLYHQLTMSYNSYTIDSQWLYHQLTANIPQLTANPHNDIELMLHWWIDVCCIDELMSADLLIDVLMNWCLLTCCLMFAVWTDLYMHTVFEYVVDDWGWLSFFLKFCVFVLCC